MNDTAEKLRALRDAANVQGANERLQQFRADFKLVWHYWRISGDISEFELERDSAIAAAAVKAHQADAEWMDCAMNHFREMAARIETPRSAA